jgi:lipopolysaccharide transport protein LptA
MKRSSTCDRTTPSLAAGRAPGATPRQRFQPRISAALALLGMAPLLLAAPKAEEARPPEISYDASSMDADVKTHVMHLKDVTITYGKMTVRADRALATAGDFKNSRWTFDGNVRINAEPRGNLRSDEAVVEFEDNQLKRATATGNPAEFDQKREDSDIIARGHADQIIYEVGSGTVRLANDAWVTDGRNDIRGPLIVYSLREEHVQATTSPGTDTRVHVTIAPNEAPKADGGGTNKSKPAAPDSGKPQTATPQPSSSPPAPPRADAAAAASSSSPALQSPPPQSTPH